MSYFIPTKRPSEAELAALQKAGETLDRMLAEHGIDVEEVVAEFDAMRKKARKPPGSNNRPG